MVCMQDKLTRMNINREHDLSCWEHAAPKVSLLTKAYSCCGIWTSCGSSTGVFFWLLKEKEQYSMFWAHFHGDHTPLASCLMTYLNNEGETGKKQHPYKYTNTQLQSCNMKIRALYRHLWLKHEITSDRVEWKDSGKYIKNIAFINCILTSKHSNEME